MMPFIDERFLEHRRRSTSVAVIVGGVLAALLWAYRYYFNHVLNFSARWTHGAADAWIYGAMGLMYGLSIGLLLLSVRLKARRGGTACQ